MKRMRIVIAALGASLASTVHALDVQVHLIGPTQVTAGQGLKTADVSAGLVVVGTADGYALSVAGGFTITCEYNSMSIHAQSGDYVSKIIRPPSPLTLTVPVPDPAPDTYTTANFSSLFNGECKVCNFQWKGTASGTAIGFSGYGANVSLPGPTKTKANTKTFQMCRNQSAGGGSHC